jgi:hypothetical protein
MKPCIFSKKKFEKEQIGWFRGGENITYKQNEITRDLNDQSPPRNIKGAFNNGNSFLLSNNGVGEGVDFFYTFSFTYEFEANVDDEVSFAHAVPYTYTNMQEKII